MERLDYVREPAEIYRRSFAAIEALDAVNCLNDSIRQVAIRIVHACGMPEIARDLRYSTDAVRMGRNALERGAPIFCDVDSVRTSIISRLLPDGVRVHCQISAPETKAHARLHAMTRAAAQMDLWGERLAGAIVVIGNAPTALFRLLEAVDGGAPKPSLVLAFPVGFVGAAEAKAELMRSPRGMEFVALPGRRGGSAMAAAAMNAVAGGLST